MQCPRDGRQLERRLVEGVEIDACPKCDGLFLDQGELEAIEKAYHAHAAAPDPAAPMRDAVDAAQQRRRAGALCPRCQLEMSPHEYAYTSQIIVDGCGRCGGMWLDVGELERIEDFFERETSGQREPGTVLAGLLVRLGLRPR